jgi:O-antigen/teichoic acid export membrane protein
LLEGHTPFFKGSGWRGRLLRGGMGTFAIQVGRLGSELALSIVLARSLGAEGYGIYAFAFAVVKVLQIPAEVGMGNLVLRFTATYLAKGAMGRLRGLWDRLLKGHILYGFMCAGGVWLHACRSSNYPQSEVLGVAALLLVAMPLTAFYAAALRGLGHAVLGQLPEHTLRPFFFLLGLLILRLFATKLQLTPQIALLLHGAAIILSGIYAYYCLTVKSPRPTRKVPPQYEDRKWLKTFLPLCFVGGMAVVNNNLDILMLGWLKTPAQVGIYRVAVQGANLVALSLTAVNLVVGPEIARLYALGEKEKLQKMLTWGAKVAFTGAMPAAISFLLFGRLMLRWFFGSEFESAYGPLLVLVLGQLVNAASGSVGFVLNMTGHEKDAAWGVAIAALINAVLNIFLIPRYGLFGAAAATAFSMSAWNVFFIYSVGKRTGLTCTILHAIAPRRCQ